ncbi:MAG: ferredoxin family protein [Desulfovibrionaceae bacterium]|nr:ferredoxin family protein [Desulfovibrionaceae bacterium]
MDVAQKLSVDKFVVNEGNPHIVIHLERLDEAARHALTVVCPAGLYTLDEKGRMAFEVAGCLECGTCRVAVGHVPGLMEWSHPKPSFGVQFRFG